MKKIVYLVALLLSCCVSAQQLPVHNQFFLNPYFINPSYVGFHNQPEAFFVHRQNRQGIASAPVTTTFSLQIPTKGQAAFGLKVVDNVSGILANTSSLATFGYAFKLGEKHYFRAAVSGGLGKYSVDRNRLENESDWLRVKPFNNKSFFDANIGVSYQIKGLTLGASLPTLLNKRLVNTNPDDLLDFKQVSYYVFNAGYHLKFSEGFAFMPQVLYRYSTQIPSQYEALGTLYLKSVWIGGGYRQNQGPAAYAGLKIKKTVSLGYSYEPVPAQLTAFGKGTHEVLLGISFEQMKGKNADRAKRLAEAQQKEEKAQAEREKKAELKQKEEAKKQALKEKASAKKAADKEKAAEKAATNKAKAEKAKEKRAKETAARKEKAQAKKAKEKQSKEAKATKAKAKTEKEAAAKAAKTQKATAPQSEDKETVPAPAKPVIKAEPKPAPATQPAKEEERIEEQKREHPLELKKGNYVVVGSFNVFENAVRFNRTIYNKGMHSDYRYSSKTNRYYVFVHQSGSLEDARGERDRIRELEGITDAWVLIVE